jgi:hypothetical protein
MLRIANNPIMLSVVMPNVVMPNVVMLSVMAPLIVIKHIYYYFLLIVFAKICIKNTTAYYSKILIDKKDNVYITGLSCK